jgi:hypothetical protein
LLPRRAPQDIVWPGGSRTDRMCPHPSKPNSFVVAIRDRDRFKEAIRTKLVLVVAGGTPDRPGGRKEPLVPCLIGEGI